MVLPLFIAAVATMQAAPATPQQAPTAPRATLEERFGRAFMSPMGEPFFGRAAGEDGLTAWFAQTDRNHDGAITIDEMTADAQRFFETLDIDHDGEIGPDEISHYEEAIAPQVLDPEFYAPRPVEAGLSGQGDTQGQRGKRRHAGGRLSGGGGGDDEAGAGRYGLLESPEPVTSADSDFNRGVSTAEFQNAAVHRFQQLDLNHSGRLTLPELEGIREAASSAARRAHAKENEAPMDANGDTGGPGM